MQKTSFFDIETCIFCKKKLTKKKGNHLHFSNEKADLWEKAWKVSEKCLSLQCQNTCFGYPGKFPERASRKHHYPICKAVHPMCGFGFI